MMIDEVTMNDDDMDTSTEEPEEKEESMTPEMPEEGGSEDEL